jgi:nucleolar complex protein 2
VLSAHAPASQDLQPLIYPVTQLMLGAARLVPSARWFPVRLRIARVLIALASATSVFVPVTPILLEIVSWPDFAKPAKGSASCPDLLMQLRLSKTNLKQPSVQQALVEQARHCCCGCQHHREQCDGLCCTNDGNIDRVVMHMSAHMCSCFDGLAAACAAPLS